MFSGLTVSMNIVQRVSIDEARVMSATILIESRSHNGEMAFQPLFKIRSIHELHCEVMMPRSSPKS